MNIGVYQIKNLITNKTYIGSSTKLNMRKNKHFSDLKLNKHKNQHLQNSYNKYGKENFKFNILYTCDTINDLILAEQIFINVFKPEYNIRTIAKNNSGFKHTVATKKKMSLSSLGHPCTKETKRKIGNANKGNKHNIGRKMSSVTKEKIRKIHIGNKYSLGRKQSREEVLKRMKSVIQYDLNGNIIKEYESVLAATKAIKGSSGNITKCCKGILNTYKGYKWKYKLNK